MGVDPNSVVDYLKRHKQSADFQSRRILWGQFDPRKPYTGSASQNSRLLNALKLGEAAPRLEFVSPTVPMNAEIRAKILSMAPVLIENGLTGLSSNAAPNETILLGTANRFGLIPMHIRTENTSTKSVSSLGQLALLPHDGQVRVNWWSVPTESTEESFMITVADPSVKLLVEQFFNHFGDVAEVAAKLAAKDLLSAANASAIMFDVFAGTVALLIPGAQAVTVLVTAQLAEYGLDFSAKFIEQAIQLAPQPSQQADKDTLKALLTGPLTAARVGLSVVNLSGGIKKIPELKRNLDLCESIVELEALSSWTIDRFVVPAEDEKDIQVAGSLLRNSLGNLISIVCAAQKKK